MQFKKEELIKSPLNYTGGKFKLLPQILPLIPDDINKFYDLFAGGCNVGVNVKANKVICNDIEPHIINLFNELKSINSEEVIKFINEQIIKYELSETDKYGYEFYGCNSSDGVAKHNKDKYLKLRSDYNKDTSNNLLFFTVLIFAFSNQIRFNSKGEFNMAVNKNIKNNLIKFINKINNMDIAFSNNDYKLLNVSLLNKNDFIYCDPPYLITCANYNEQDGWNEAKEVELLSLLDELDSKGIRFALSNVLESKGKSNNILKEWTIKYNIHYLNHTYGNCNYHTKDKSNNSTVEVLITNY